MEVLNAKAFHGDPNFASSCSHDVLPSPVSLTGILFWGKGLEKRKNFCALVEIKLHKTLRTWLEVDKKTKRNQTKTLPLAHVHGCLYVSHNDILKRSLNTLVSSNLINKEPISSPFPVLRLNS